jgi:hypothetical protein
VASIFACTDVCGITTVHRTPWRDAARASAWPWLPDEWVTTPAARRAKIDQIRPRGDHWGQEHVADDAVCRSSYVGELDQCGGGGCGHVARLPEAEEVQTFGPFVPCR